MILGTTRIISLFLLVAVSAVTAEEVASVSGKVIGPLGEPLRKAAVSLEVRTGSDDATDAQSSRCTTDSEGNFVFVDVRPGNYAVRAERVGYIAQYFGRHEEGTLLSIAPEQHVQDIVIRLVPEAVVNGRILDTEGDPSGQADVLLFKYEYVKGQRRVAVEAQAQSDSSGEFTLRGIAPGRYYLAATPHDLALGRGDSSAQAEKREFSYVTTYYPGQPEATSASAIEVAPGGRINVADITLQRVQCFRVRGTVRLQTNDLDRHNLSVRLYETNGTAGSPFPVPSSRADAAGRFDIAGVPSGTYLLMVTPTAGRLRSLATLPVQIGTRDLSDVVVDIHDAAVITGRVLYEGDSCRAQTPKGGLRVSLRPTDNGLLDIRSELADTQGTFRFDKVGPRRYIVYPALLPDGAYVKTIRSGAVDVLEQGLDLTSGAGSADLTVVLRCSPAKVMGTLQGKEGHPATASTVTLVPSPMRPERPDLYRRTIVSADGTFQFGNLAPGDYCLYPWGEIAPGEEYNPDILQKFSGYCRKISLKEGDILRSNVEFLSESR